MLVVLQLMPPPSPKGTTPGGVSGPERRTANLAGRWRSHDIKAVIGYPRRGKLWQEFVDSGVEIVDFEIAGKFDVTAPAKIARLARARGAQVIHTQGPPSLDLLAVMAARMAGISSVVTRPVMIEDEISRSPLRRLVYGLIDRWVTATQATRYVAVSKDGFDRLQKHTTLRGRRLKLIHNGVDLGRFSVKAPSNSNGSSPNPPVVIGMIGHLLDYKGWPDFIEVIRRLAADKSNVRGLIVGEGSDRVALEEIVRKKGLKDIVQFCGYRADVRPVLAEMDVFLFTTLREGLSVAVIEAMASGLPIVATSVGGIAEQIEDGRNGYIVAAHDLGAMVAHCTALIRSPRLRASMGENARRIAEERFGEARMLAEYAACYRDVADEKGTSIRPRLAARS
ncbi:MAG: glycosyltransferase [Proteobacteria bacterium]|nr:glycosyltransferase [Pseudomonadota bacterium]